MEDRQIDENTKHTVDQTDRKMSTETFIPDQFLTEVTAKVIIATVHIQNLEIDPTLMTDHEVFKTTETKTIQAIVTETILTVDHGIVPAKSHTKSYINRSRVNIKIDKIIIKTDQETTISHHIETIHENQIDKIKTLEAVHQNFNNKSINYNLHAKQLHGNFSNSTKPYTLWEHR